MARRRSRRMRVLVANQPRRNRTRRNRARKVVQVTTTERALVPTGAPIQRLNRPLRMARRGRISRNPMSMVSEAGMAFLKCAFAPPDFSVDPGKGIPDRFQGRTVSIKDCFTSDVAFTAGKDTYILVSPIPGVAYAKCEVDIGSQPVNFKTQSFPTAVANFGSVYLDGDTNSDTVVQSCDYTKFRYASLAAGLYSTSNFMQFGGSISVWKADVRLSDVQMVAVTDPTPEAVKTNRFTSLRINGLESVGPLVPRDSYSTSFQEGAFVVATENNEDFAWSDFSFANEYSNRGFGATEDASTRTISPPLAPDACLPGMGSTESIIIKVSTPTGAVNNASLRIWNCIEVVPKTNTNVFQFSSLSPTHDPLAIELYQKLKSQLPVAVPARLNVGTWDRISKVLFTFFSAGANVPGPVGMLSGGLAGVTEALRLLTV